MLKKMATMYIKKAHKMWAPKQKTQITDYS